MRKCLSINACSLISGHLLKWWRTKNSETWLVEKCLASIVQIPETTKKHTYTPTTNLIFKCFTLVSAFTWFNDCIYVRYSWSIWQAQTSCRFDATDITQSNYFCALQNVQTWANIQKTNTSFKTTPAIHFESFPRTPTSLYLIMSFLNCTWSIFNCH